LPPTFYFPGKIYNLKKKQKTHYFDHGICRTKPDQNGLRFWTGWSLFLFDMCSELEQDISIISNEIKFTALYNLALKNLVLWICLWYHVGLTGGQVHGGTWWGLNSKRTWSCKLIFFLLVQAYLLLLFNFVGDYLFLFYITWILRPICAYHDYFSGLLNILQAQ